MMPGRRKRYSAELKTKVAVEAIRRQKTANEIATEYGIHPTQIAQWKKQALDGLPDLFSTRKSDQAQSKEALINTLYQQIGQLKVQVNWLEKNQNRSIEEKRALIEPDHPELSIRQQCELDVAGRARVAGVRRLQHPAAAARCAER